MELTVPLAHGPGGPCEAVVRPLSAGDARAIAGLRRALPPAMLATAILERAVVRLADSDRVTARDLRFLTAGDRERLLLGTFASSYGPRLELVARCPECGETAELELAAGDLVASTGDGQRETCFIEAGVEIAVRLPTGEDQEECARRPAEAASILLSRCVIVDGGDSVPAVAAADGDIALRVDRAIAAMDPLATGSLDFPCPACGTSVPGQFDALTLLLARLPPAEALDAATDRLARAYGWREPEIMALPVARHALYARQAGAR